MKYFVAVTDNSWYEYLAALGPAEVNFWRPSGTDTFRAIRPGSPFLFKLHAPHNFVAGGGFFVKFEVLPLSLAWEVFGEENGASDPAALLSMVRRHRTDQDKDPPIGCVVLGDPFFLPRPDWIPVPEDWAPNIVRGKSYDTQTPAGARLWDQVSQFLVSRKSELGADLLKETAFSDGDRFGPTYLTRSRLGQGIFRVMVIDAYARQCAVSGERVLPALEAAHIKPYTESGPHRVSNGLLLRSDIHRLFDKGYLTVTPDLRVEVSGAVREDFDNGRHYYSFHGRELSRIPTSPLDRPAHEYLEWHNSSVYRGT